MIGPRRSQGLRLAGLPRATRGLYECDTGACGLTRRIDDWGPPGGPVRRLPTLCESERRGFTKCTPSLGFHFLKPNDQRLASVCRHERKYLPWCRHFNSGAIQFDPYRIRRYLKARCRFESSIIHAHESSPLE